MAQDNGNPGGVKISTLATGIDRNLNLRNSTVRRRLATRINRQVAQQTGASLASVRRANIGLRVIAERLRQIGR